MITDLEQSGYTIIPDALPPDGVAAVRGAMAPYFADGPHGRNDFEGFHTKRVYSLVAKSRCATHVIPVAQR